MPRATHPHFTVDEITSYLRRTSQATILVEGRDDQKVYRYVEDQLTDLDVDVLICDGRDSLLAIFRRRTEFARAPVVFVADRDMWYFTGIPDEFATEIVFTEGYSIENDLYVREVFEALMSESELAQFRALIQCIARWQAFHVETFRVSGRCSCDVYLNQIVAQDVLSSEHLASIGFIEPPAATVMQIIESYPFALRGKTLFQALV